MVPVVVGAGMASALRMLAGSMAVRLRPLPTPWPGVETLRLLFIRFIGVLDSRICQVAVALVKAASALRYLS